MAAPTTTLLVLLLARQLRADEASNLDINVNVTTRIIGGINAVSKEFPYQAALTDQRDSHLCGVVILTERMALTVAHCVDLPTTAYSKPYRVIAGRIKRSSYAGWEKSAQKTVVVAVFPHQKYNRINDIAMLILDPPLKFTAFVNKMAFLPASYRIPEGSNLIATGWGLTVGGPTPSAPALTLMKVGLPFIGPTKCSQTRGIQVLPSQFCVGGIVGKDICEGDSGGPISAIVRGWGWSTYKYVLGLTSLGGICGNGRPAIFTKLSEYVPWMRKVAKQARVPLWF